MEGLETQRELTPSKNLPQSKAAKSWAALFSFYQSKTIQNDQIQC